MVTLYVEGGGDSAALSSDCREGFRKFITKAGVQKRPRIVACGSRQNAYDSDCTAIANRQEAMLLVDTDAPVAYSVQITDNDSTFVADYDKSGAVRGVEFLGRRTNAPEYYRTLAAKSSKGPATTGPREKRIT